MTVPVSRSFPNRQDSVTVAECRASGKIVGFVEIDSEEGYNKIGKCFKGTRKKAPAQRCSRRIGNSGTAPDNGNGIPGRAAKKGALV